MISKIIKINTDNNQRVCSIDASTNSMAFAIFENKKLICVGKINFSGDTIYKKIGDSYAKIRAFFKSYEIDSVVIEHTIFMNSPKTVSDLALIQGAILAAMWESDIKEMGSVSPITWQNYIGNKKISKDEQLLIRSQHPGKSVSWYKSYERNLRKERTIKFINTIYDRTITDNDVADACGIGHWALRNWGKAIGVDK